MDVVRFATNVPQVLQFASLDGREKEGKFGIDWEFRLKTGQLVYLKQEAAAKLYALEPRIGEPIQICRREVTSGRARGYVWEVERVADLARPVAAAPRVAPPANGAPPIAWAFPTADERGTSVQASPRPPADGSTDTDTSRQQRASADSPIVHTAVSRMYAGALISAIDALVTAERYAQSKYGRTLTFNEEDARCIATTFFIEGNRALRGGPSWQQ